MALEPGTRLGLYEIVGPLGAGGMGEVYRARDTKLGREVALKVLPDALAREAERQARFEREARLLASLNHASIATLHGFEEADGSRFLVMELVPGETLEERLARGPLADRRGALDLARQIADALEAAHAKGIVHRDLKPGNVKITPEGRVKVLDFGLAKALESDGGSADASDSPTLTRAGAVLGTAAYMSPEQARGQEVDRRADVWAFGCLLYAMLAGRRAFGGETSPVTLAAVLRSEPDWSALPREVPPSVRKLLRRCLEKDPERRLRGAADIRLEVEEALEARRRRGTPPRDADGAGPGSADGGLGPGCAEARAGERPPGGPRVSGVVSRRRRAPLRGGGRRHEEDLPEAPGQRRRGAGHAGRPRRHPARMVARRRSDPLRPRASGRGSASSRGTCSASTWTATCGRRISPPAGRRSWRKAPSTPPSPRTGRGSPWTPRGQDRAGSGSSTRRDATRSR